MTLVARLLLFFLGTLAVVLAGFSLALYAAARSYLDRQVTERSEAALQRLTAAVEVEHGRLEWEPYTRELHLEDPGAAGLSWRVIDNTGRLVDRSPGTPDEDHGWPAIHPASFGLAHPVISDSADGDWRFASLAVSVQSGASSPPISGVAMPHALLIQTAMPLRPMRALLNRLGLLSMALSLALWLSAAGGGRAICRRALSPLTAMASAARTMQANALSRRLPEPNTGDECQDLARVQRVVVAGGRSLRATAAIHG